MEYDLERGTEYLDRLLELPVYNAIGEDFDDHGTALRVADNDEYVHAMQETSWLSVTHNALNFHARQIINCYGMDWFQKNNNSRVKEIEREMELRNIRELIESTWSAKGIPEQFGEVWSAQQWTFSFIKTTVYDHSLGFDENDTFGMRFVEPWLLAGHLPCGWYGTVPKAPESWAGRPLDHVMGDGCLRVY